MKALPRSVGHSYDMLSVIVQAGGESRRMGQDKALRPFLGRPLIERVLARVAPIANEVFVVTNRPMAYQFLGYPLAADLLPGRGALGGLYTALSTATHPAVAVVGCDMPFVSAGLLAFQRDLLQAEEADVVIPGSSQGLEPFHAVYRRATCLPSVRSALDAETWRVSAWLDTLRLRTLSLAEVLRHDPQQRAFYNVNTPEEFAAAEQWAGEQSA